MNLDSLNAMLAQAGTPATQPNPTGQMVQMVAMIAIVFAMLYFMTIRPQSKQRKEHAAMLKAMKAGDKVLTSGGLVGTVVSVKEKTVAIRSAETKLEVLKSAVTEITDRAGESPESPSRAS